MAPPTLGPPAPRRLGDLLVSDGIVSPEALQQALLEQRRTGDKLGSVLVRLRLLTEEELVGFLSRQYRIPSIALSQLEIDPAVVRLLPEAIARKHEVLPVRRTGKALTVAIGDPANVSALDDVAFATNLSILPVVAAQGAIRSAIERAYGATAAARAGGPDDRADEAAALELVTDGSPAAPIDAFDLRESADDPPVVRLVNAVLADAIRQGASDIHWEPYERVFRVRLRVDGVLREAASPPKRLEAAVVSRLKIMASLDIAERRLPQDGRIKLRYQGREIDFRVSILPTIFGEKVVLRILDRDALKLDLGALGFDEWSLRQFLAAIRQPYGMVLITGPTGSGKTTTLYTAIHAINAPGVNIMTVEDPVEYNLLGVNQVQVNEAIGRTFASALRAFLRQDPDVILVGETRDLETAQIAVRAALTGHLVFSTLHTNDCPSTVARLTDMGIPPFLVSSALTLVLAQRLGRTICKECREPLEIEEDALAAYGHRPTGAGRVVLYRARGCSVCNFTGMKGRAALYEVMPITQDLRDMIVRGAPTSALRAAAQALGMRSLRQAGMLKVLDGTTTVEEVLRVTAGD